MADGQVVFEISADNRPAKNAINDTTDALKKAGREWESNAEQSTDSVADKFSGMFKKISIAAAAMKAGGALLDFSKDAIQVASNLEEVQNVVDVTFGESASKIDAWAKTASQNFGLTELQAKQFTSTLGAMMKSSGLAGDEIVDMSTSLAGLAADMASFYNLDFDTAFQKIRSGISGETEPLKQLGINLSVANLEAFALQQGLQKTFSEMSSAEQTMLRYQYIMQATSDAQGDFARTSDGYANSMRKLQTNVENLKAALGKPLLDVVTEATGFLDKFIEKLAPAEKKRTILDEIADIDIKKELKIADIQYTADLARGLLGELDRITEKIGVTGDITQYFETVSGSISSLETTLGDNQIGENVDTLLGELNPPVGDTIAGEVKKIREGLAEEEKNIGGSTIGETLSQFVGKLNPKVKDTIADTVEKVRKNLETENTKIGENPIGETLSGIAGELNPTVNKTIADKVKEIRENLATENGELKTQSVEIPQNAQALANGLNPPVEEHIGTTLEGITGDINEFAQKLANNGVEAAMAGFVEDLDPTIGDTVSKPIETIENDIKGLENKLANNSVESGMNKLAGKLNPTVDDAFSNTVGVIAANIGELVANTANASGVGTTLGGIAEGANKLRADSYTNWMMIFTALQNVDGLENIFTDSAAGNVADLAGALSNNSPDESRADAWKKFLDALGTNAGALSSLTGKSAQETGEWLKAMATAVDEANLSSSDADAWNTLLTSFVSGLPGLQDTEAGDEFFSALISNFLSMGSESEAARQGLAALGYESDDIAAAQKNWLGICKSLVDTIPELSSIINTQTGEIQGGTQAVEDYIEAWKADKILAARIESLKAQKAAIEQELNYDWELEIAKKRSTFYAELRKAGLSESDAAGVVNYGDWYTEGKTIVAGGVISKDQNLVNAAWAYDQAERDYATAQRNNAFALEEYDNKIAELEEQTGKTAEELLGMGDAMDETAASASTLSRAVNDDKDALNEIETALKNAEQAFKELADYQENVRKETEQSVASTVKGFDALGEKLGDGIWKMSTPAANARREVESLKDQIAELNKKGEDTDGLVKQQKAAQDAIPSLQKMTLALESQIAYMDEYKRMLDAARANGVSDELLAQFSDGSQESFDYLYALTDALEGMSDEDRSAAIANLNERYAEAQVRASEFTDTLTEQKLTADETFQSLVEAANEAAAGLNVSDEAYFSVSETVGAIQSALADNYDGIKNKVDAIMAQLARLSGSYRFGAFESFGSFAFVGRSSGASEANGIDYVPYDGYLAMLHQGERVQTAAEADLARRYSYQQPTFDYDAMGGAIGSNIKGGNVYLDGKTVGRIISDRQANSYRALERSGWQE